MDAERSPSDDLAKAVERIVDLIDAARKAPGGRLTMYESDATADYLEAVIASHAALETLVLDTALSDKLDETGTPLSWRERALAAEAILDALATRSADRAGETTMDAFNLGRILYEARIREAMSEETQASFKANRTPEEG